MIRFFGLTLDGKRRRVRAHATMNTRRGAGLNWQDRGAELERLLAEQPRVELLPEYDARPIVPPSDTELNAILDEARTPALLEVAPLLPEAIELAVETGLRKEELFRLTWRSVDTSLGPNREERSASRSRPARVWSVARSGRRRMDASGWSR